MMGNGVYHCYGKVNTDLLECKVVVYGYRRVIYDLLKGIGVYFCYGELRMTY